MNRAHRICRSLASLTMRAGGLLACRASAAAPALRSGPSRSTVRSPVRPGRAIVTSDLRVGARPEMPRIGLGARALSARVPHTIQLCVHCRENPAGFWVNHSSDKTVRRPWCLSCCDELDRGLCNMIPFDS
jgi:hypothetical protein